MTFNSFGWRWLSGRVHTAGSSGRLLNFLPQRGGVMTIPLVRLITSRTRQLLLLSKQASRTRAIGGSLLLVAATSIAVLSGPAGANAQEPGANGLIAFIRDNSSVYTMHADGSAAHEVIASGFIRQLAWRPDGNALLFTATAPDASDTDLFMMQPDGTSITRLTTGGLAVQDPVWSPDGSRIAFFAGAAGPAALETIRADGSDPVVLDASTDSSGNSCVGPPAWSPDGTRIVYFHACGSVGLWSIPADGSGPASQLTTGATDYQADYSPDGSSLVIQRDNVLTLVDADGSNPRPIATTNPAVTPEFSPDGRQIVFGAAGPDQSTPRIYTINTDGTGETLLDGDAPQYHGDTAPAWQPVNSETVDAGTPPTTAPGSASTKVFDGGTVNTGSATSPAIPLAANISVPPEVSGTVSVRPQATTTTPPTGFTFFSTEFVIDAPPATADSPYSASFTIDGSLLGGTTAADLQVFRNGSLVSDCADPYTDSPDPCVASRRADVDGSVSVRILTSHFSTWSFGKKPSLSYTLTGPFPPVNAYPTENTAKAGSAIPVKFGLGGNKGLDVFASGYPKTATATCGATSGEAEPTVATSNAPLSYDATTGRYTWVWKTTPAMKGCQDLFLKFRDGSQLRASFKLR